MIGTFALRVLLEHRANAGDDIAGALTRTDDVGQHIADSFHVGFSTASQRKAALAFNTIPVIGWLISCAIDADKLTGGRQAVHVREFSHGVARTDLGKRPPPVLVDQPGDQCCLQT